MLLHLWMLPPVINLQVRLRRRLRRRWRRRLSSVHRLAITNYAFGAVAADHLLSCLEFLTFFVVVIATTYILLFLLCTTITHNVAMSFVKQTKCCQLFNYVAICMWWWCVTLNVAKFQKFVICYQIVAL